MEVLTRSELIGRLGSRHALDLALEAGRWTRVLHGAYVEDGDSGDLATRARAIRVVLPKDTWVADRCLLWMLGIDVLPAGPPMIEAVVPRGAVIPRRHGLKVREARVPLGDRCVFRSVRVLRPERAVVDLLRLLPDIEAVVVADAALRGELVTSEGLATELISHARLRGVRRAARALDLADPRSESPPESRVRFLLLQAGVPVVPQFDVRTAGGVWIARVDLALPELKIAIEYDGRAVHEREDVFVRDRQRQNALVQAGWTVLRFTAADLRHGGLRLVLAVEAAVRAARRAA
jgi:very-short-patch-repair endonuclease